MKRSTLRIKRSQADGVDIICVVDLHAMYKDLVANYLSDSSISSCISYISKTPISALGGPSPISTTTQAYNCVVHGLPGSFKGTITL
jgi:hypothetical protein